MSAPHYTAAGGVLVDDDGRVLVLLRPSRNEVRLPKGHVEGFETVEEGAVRETVEETGYPNIEIVHDLGTQIVEFVNRWSPKSGKHVREERFYLMRLVDDTTRKRPWEDLQFDPIWVSWDEALERLTFEAEREWVRRARALWRAQPPQGYR